MERALARGPGALYASERDTLEGKVDAYALGNLTISGDLSKNVGVSFGLYNISDGRYADPVNPIVGVDAIEQDGFNVRFKLTVGF